MTATSTLKDLLYFRSATFQDVFSRHTEAWKYILDNGVHLPTPYIRLFDDQGEYKGRRYMGSNGKGGHTGTTTSPSPQLTSEAPPDPNPYQPSTAPPERNPSSSEALLQPNPFSEAPPQPNPSSEAPPQPNPFSEAPPQPNPSSEAPPQPNPFSEAPPQPNLSSEARPESCGCMEPSTCLEHPSSQLSKSAVVGSPSRSIEHPYQADLHVALEDPAYNTPPTASWPLSLQPTIHTPSNNSSATTSLTCATPGTQSNTAQLQPVELFSANEVHGSEPQTGIITTEVEEEVTIDNTVDDLQNEPSTESSSAQIPLKSKAAILIHKAIGTSQNLTVFDDMRTKLKEKKALPKHRKPTVTEQEQYRKQLAILHTSVLSTKYRIKESVQTMEVQYYKSHGHFPTHTQQEYGALRKKLDYIKKTQQFMAHI